MIRSWSVASAHSHGALMMPTPSWQVSVPRLERPFDTRNIERRQLDELSDLAVGADRAPTEERTVIKIGLPFGHRRTRPSL